MDELVCCSRSHAVGRVRLDLVANSIRRQTILSQLLHHENEAMVRLILRDPLPGSAAVLAGNGEGGGDEDTSKGSVQVIGPIALSRQDSLDVIEQKIQVRACTVSTRCRQIC